jgi:hypothetical protein
MQQIKAVPKHYKFYFTARNLRELKTHQGYSKEGSLLCEETTYDRFLVVPIIIDAITLLISDSIFI